MFLASALDFQRASSTSLCHWTTSAVILKETQNVGFEGEGVFCFEPEFLISSFSKEKTQWQVPKWGGTNKQTNKKSQFFHLHLRKNCRNAQQAKPSSLFFSHRKPPFFFIPVTALLVFLLTCPGAQGCFRCSEKFQHLLILHNIQL